MMEEEKAEIIRNAIVDLVVATNGHFMIEHKCDYHDKKFCGQIPAWLDEYKAARGKLLSTLRDAL